MKILLVAKLDPTVPRVYAAKWRTEMKLLVVSNLDRFARAVTPVTKYVEAAKALGHEVAVFGERNPAFPVPYSLDVKHFDCAVFVTYMPSDFPDLPYLARLLDGMPKERRVIIDCEGRFNETIRVGHDFNHLEKLDGHQGWEWVEGFQAVSDRILQPTQKPLRPDVRSFLFHAFDPAAVAKPFTSASEAARAWLDADKESKPYGLVYVGNNWQRWEQLSTLLKGVERLNGHMTPMCFAGWNWDKRPDWAIEHGLQGVDVDVDLMKRMNVEAKDAVPFTEVIDFASKGRFNPIVRRPLYNQLGLVNNRTFETFCADTMPLLMFSREDAVAIYGPDAARLVPGDDVAAHVEDVLANPEPYWDAVLKTRAYLTQHHSYTERVKELVSILES